MAEKDIRLAAADLLFQRGVRFRLTGAPFLWRVFRLDRISITHLRLGAIVEISRVVSENGLEDAGKQKLAANIDKVALCIAIAMLNNKRKIKRWSQRLSVELVWRLPANALLTVFFHLQNLNEVLDFTGITNWMSAQTTMMKPKHLGRTGKGS